MWNLLPSLLGNVRSPEPQEYIKPDDRQYGSGAGGFLGAIKMLPQLLAGVSGGNLGGEVKHAFQGMKSGNIMQSMPLLLGVLGGGLGNSLFNPNRGGMSIGGLGGGFLPPSGFQGITPMPPGGLSNQIPYSPSGGITGLIPNFLGGMPFGGGMFGGRNSMRIMGGNVDDSYQKIQDKQNEYL